MIALCKTFTNEPAAQICIAQSWYCKFSFCKHACKARWLVEPVLNSASSSGYNENQIKGQLGGTLALDSRLPTATFAAEQKKQGQRDGQRGQKGRPQEKEVGAGCHGKRWNKPTKQ